MGRKAAGGKDPFADLDKEFKEKVDSAGPDGIVVRSLISDVAIAEAMNQVAKDLDLDLAEKAALHKEAGADYAEATAQNKLKIKYATSILEQNGKL